MKRLKRKVMLLVPFGAAAAVSSLATFSDWSKNPGGIFRDSAGTSWPVVLETACSWFVPVLLVVALGQAVWIVLTNR